jgi:hypothetical protein
MYNINNGRYKDCKEGKQSKAGQGTREPEYWESKSWVHQRLGRKGIIRDLAPKGQEGEVLGCWCIPIPIYR